MSKLQKLLLKIASSPTPSNIKWEELKACLNGLGYELMRNDGSRRKFYNKHTNKLIICHEPHPRPEVDKGCINYIVDHLRENGVL